MNQLLAKNVQKQFGKKIVIQNANLMAKSGQVIGLVGENGSGKTVLMKICVGLMKATQGEVLYNGLRLKKDMEYLPSVGLIIEHPGFYGEMSGFENLMSLAMIQNKIGEKEILYWLDKVGLKNDHKPVGKYSLGMIQRLGIAQALMENPDVLILDEFTSGLDEDGILMAHQLLMEEKQKGKIIIISSHSKYDIQQLCDEIYLMKGGILYHEKNTHGCDDY